jgi:hypothetical protein
MKKRILLTIITMVIAFSMSTVPVSADWSPCPQCYEAPWLCECWLPPPPTSGTLSTGLTWDFNGDILTISGNGEIPDFNPLGDMPWFAIRDSIQTVVIENGVIGTGLWAFNGCTNLTLITLPSTFIEIGESAFEGCSNLASITIPDSVITISGWAFESSGLKSIIIPNSVINLNNRAFLDCTSLETVVLGDGVTEIGYQMFANLPALKSVAIGNNVTSIGDSAFFGATALESIVIPDSVESIGEMAFSNCTSLTSVIIGRGVTSIGTGAFDACNNLTEVVFMSETPPATDTNILFRTVFPNNPNLTIIVPEGAGEAFRAIEQFSGFDIVEADVTGIEIPVISPITSNAGEITINTALTILKHLAGLEIIPDEEVPVYDFDEDGEIGIGDALEVLKWLAGLESKINNGI